MILSLQSKLIGLAVYTAFTILMTIHVHNKFLDAEELATRTSQLDQAQKAPAAIIKFQQDLGNTNAKKDTCFNTDIPADALRLLK